MPPKNRRRDFLKSIVSSQTPKNPAFKPKPTEIPRESQPSTVRPKKRPQTPVSDSGRSAKRRRSWSNYGDDSTDSDWDDEIQITRQTSRNHIMRSVYSNVETLIRHPQQDSPRGTVTDTPFDPSAKLVQKGLSTAPSTPIAPTTPMTPTPTKEPPPSTYNLRSSPASPPPTTGPRRLFDSPAYDTESTPAKPTTPFRPAHTHMANSSVRQPSPPPPPRPSPFGNQRTPSPKPAPQSPPPKTTAPTRTNTDIVSNGRRSGGCLTQTQKIGFHNQKFVCYANASMVALLKLPWFTRVVMAKSVVQAIEEHPVPQQIRTARELVEVIRAASLTNSWNTISLKALRSSLGIDMANDNLQQDAHEFTTFLMGAFAQNFEATELFRAVAASKGGKLKPSTTPCPFGRVLESVAFNRGTCLGCKQEYEVRGESYYNLVAHFPRRAARATISTRSTTGETYQLSELMRTGVETVVEYTCGKCGHDRRTQVHRFRALPRVLSISINRGDKGQAKHHERVKIPEVLDMEPFCLPDASMPPSMAKDGESELPQADLGHIPDREHFARTSKSPQRFHYQLAAIVNHSGYSASCGHYVAFVRQPEGEDAPWSLGEKWSKYDDRVIREQSWAQVEDQVMKNAALVYYVAGTAVDQGPLGEEEAYIDVDLEDAWGEGGAEEEEEEPGAGGY